MIKKDTQTKKRLNAILIMMMVVILLFPVVVFGDTCIKNANEGDDSIKKVNVNCGDTNERTYVVAPQTNCDEGYDCYSYMDTGKPGANTDDKAVRYRVNSDTREIEYLSVTTEDHKTGRFLDSPAHTWINVVDAKEESEVNRIRSDLFRVESKVRDTASAKNSPATLSAPVATPASEDAKVASTLKAGSSGITSEQTGKLNKYKNDLESRKKELTEKLESAGISDEQKKLYQADLDNIKTEIDIVTSLSISDAKIADAALNTFLDKSKKEFYENRLASDFAGAKSATEKQDALNNYMKGVGGGELVTGTKDEAGKFIPGDSGQLFIDKNAVKLEVTTVNGKVLIDGEESGITLVGDDKCSFAASATCTEMKYPDGTVIDFKLNQEKKYVKAWQPATAIDWIKGGPVTGFMKSLAARVGGKGHIDNKFYAAMGKIDVGGSITEAVCDARRSANSDGFSFSRSGGDSEMWITAERINRGSICDLFDDGLPEELTGKTCVDALGEDAKPYVYKMQLYVNAVEVEIKFNILLIDKNGEKINYLDNDLDLNGGDWDNEEDGAPILDWRSVDTQTFSSSIVYEKMCIHVKNADLVNDYLSLGIGKVVAHEGIETLCTKVKFVEDVAGEDEAPWQYTKEEGKTGVYAAGNLGSTNNLDSTRSSGSSKIPSINTKI